MYFWRSEWHFLLPVYILTSTWARISAVGPTARCSKSCAVSKRSETGNPVRPKNPDLGELPENVFLQFDSLKCIFPSKYKFIIAQKTFLNANKLVYLLKNYKIVKNLAFKNKSNPWRCHNISCCSATIILPELKKIKVFGLFWKFRIIYPSLIN